MFDDFRLSILALGDNQYQLYLDLAIAPDLEPITEVVTWRPEAWLQNWADYPLETWGMMLSQALFVGDIRDQWEDLMAIAQTEQQPIRFSLGLTPGILWFLPWEAMFMGTMAQLVQVSRFQSNDSSPMGVDQELVSPTELPWLAETETPAEDVTFIQGIFANLPPEQQRETAATFLATEVQEANQTSRQWSFFTAPHLIMGVAFTVAIALGGVLIGRQLRPSPGESTLGPGITQLATTELEQLAIPDLQQLAETEIAQDNWGNGQILVEQLLDHQAFAEVKPLIFDPAIAPDSGTLAFLQGRYIWQTVPNTNATETTPAEATKGAIAMAQENWELALTQKPNDPEILMALGFGHYRRGEYEAANDRWYEALAVATNQNFPQTAQAQIYAGLAVSMYQLAQAQPESDREILLGKAQKLRAIALDLDPEHFKPNHLQKNWLWFPEAIAAWETLLTLEEIP
ncbi:MAG: hypothetical protein VKJ86_09080 [Synechococcus sp.]|nr:hypothetical protein [Synechococcus sp.]